MHRQDKVRLEIRFPAGCASQVIEQVLAAVPAGEIGCVIRCTTTSVGKTFQMLGLRTPSKRIC